MVLPVDDDVRISLSLDDLENGVRRDPTACALALAIRRQLRLQPVVTSAYIQLPGHPCYTPSTELADWLWEFDQARSNGLIDVELRRRDRRAEIAGPGQRVPAGRRGSAT